jgi:hypothetical protein
MAFKRVFLILLCVFVFGIVLQSQAQTPEVLHVIVSVEGSAYISRHSQPDNMSDENLLTAGSFVKSSDVIEAGPGSRVVILCANRTTDIISNELRSPNCSEDVSEPLVTFDQVVVYGQQRAAMDDIVYVLSPRHTITMTSQPRIEWTASEGATAYRVTLYNMVDNSIIWEKDNIQQNYLNYPQDEQPLAAVDPSETPIRYQFVVTPLVNGQELRNFDPMHPEGFCVVSARHRPYVEMAVNELSNLSLPDDLPDESTSFNLAVYYYGRRLYSEAEQELLKILPVPLDHPFPPELISAESIVGSPSYYILLGNVLYAQRLPLSYVQPAYTRAEEIALALDDTAALATINEQLADILRGRKPQVKMETDPEIYGYYASSQQYFQALDDLASVQRIETKLESPVTIQAGDLCGLE